MDSATGGGFLSLVGFEQLASGLRDRGDGLAMMSNDATFESGLRLYRSGTCQLGPGLVEAMAIPAAVGMAVGGVSGAGGGANLVRVRAAPRPSVHHVMTNKNRVSTARGGPWTPRFEDMAKRAGMTLDDAANKVVPGHRGPHPEAYHKEVFNRLSYATEGLSGDAYSAAFRAELTAIRTEASTLGSTLNQLLR